MRGGDIMKIRTPAALVAMMLALGGAAASSAQAQQSRSDVADCVRGDWESTGVTVERQAKDDFQVDGGGGVSVIIADDGNATLDFGRMHRATFSGIKHHTAVRGFVELRGEATGTVSTTALSGNSGTIKAEDVDWGDVELTVALTEPFSSRPFDRARVGKLRQLARNHGHNGLHRPTLTEATYTCGNDTLTLATTVQDQRHNDHAKLTWTFERPTR
jgi:hypothetical protein